ncbi:MAG: GGDEF domain-containing protein [Betaproteobacteria bacterium]|nr:GGDEF domain-containing protein [Betaproteobacteria bacterium]
MKIDQGKELPNDNAPAKALTKVLGQSERVKDLVEECAVELSTVNLDLKQELADGERLPGIEIALEKSEVIEDKVQVASDELAVVNLALAAEITERHDLERQLAEVTEQKDAAWHAAFHDELTGLPNRALFNDRLEHALAQATRHGWNLAVMFVDLDKFKEVNDSYGHAVGDSVLQTIAGRLKEHTRRADTMSRMGGDEFLYLLMETGDVRDVTQVAEKIIKSIQVPCDVIAGEGTVSPSVRASIGIAIFPRDGTTVEALIERADTAMYQAKQDQTGYAFAQ